MNQPDLLVAFENLKSESMEKIYLLFISYLIVTVSPVNPVIRDDKDNGMWKNNSTWNLNRQPMDGDTEVIPAV